MDQQLSPIPNMDPSVSDQSSLPPQTENASTPMDTSQVLTRIPRPSTLPRKGILKRSGSVHTPSKRGRLSPPDHQTLQAATSMGEIRQNSPSSPSGTGSFRRPTANRSTSNLSDDLNSTPSRIPKLSVTWWETNSVCGEAPPSLGRSSKQFSPPPLAEEIASDEENDDVDSIHSGVSSIGSWWAGRSTRYVPHCEKRHLHHDDTPHYLTPTQRKNREIGELKHELRRNQKMVDDKEKHLQQLRDRLGELERIMDQGGCLLENQRLQTKLQTIRDEMNSEKKQLIEQYEEKMKRLKSTYDRDSTERETTFQFELDELRSSLEREQHQQKSLIILSTNNQDDRDSGMSSSGLGFGGTMSTCDTWTMTDSQSDAVQELQAYRYECMILRNRVSELEFTVKQYEKDLITEDSCGNKTCVTRQRSQTAQLEAYKNECLVWRTKAAEMEIALKQQINSKQQLQTQIQQVQQSIKQASERQQQFTSRLRSSSSLSSLTKCSLDDLQTLINSKEDLSNFGLGEGEQSITLETKEYLQMRTKVKQLEKQLEGTKKQLKSTIGHLKGPCTKEACLNERKKLQQENQEMKTENSHLHESNESYELKYGELKRSASEREEILRTSESVIQNMEQQLTAKRTELEVTQLTLQKLKDENEKLHSEVQDMNGKLGNLESIMSDCGIVVQTPHQNQASSLRRKAGKGGHQQQQQIFRGREIQTDLTWQEETKMENELKDLLEVHQVLRAKYDEEKSDLEMKLDEISQNLHLKNSLVGTLTNQIQMLNDEYEAARSGFERERLQYNQKLHDLDLIAQRVPFLETDVAVAREEVQMAENSYEKEKGRFERAMEDSLSETMKTQQQTSDYWKSKLESTLKENDQLKKRYDQGQRESNDTKMRLNLEKLELEKKIQELFEELSQLKEKIFTQKEHRQCQTSIETEDKSILCYVKTETKSTEILKNDLFDERDEKLKMLQGELLATKRQVEILQGKLLINESVYQQLDEADTQKRESEDTIADLKEELESMKADLRLQKEHYELRLKSMIVEKEQMSLAEQERIGELETAFEHVRRELDSVIKRYEAEKMDIHQKMEEKCAALEQFYDQKSTIESESMAVRQSMEEQVKINLQLESRLNEKNRESDTLREKLKSLQNQIDLDQGLKNQELVDLTELERQIREMSCECDAYLLDEKLKKKGQTNCPVHSKLEKLIVDESSADQPVPEILFTAAGSRETSPQTKEAILDMRAKILFLLQENQQLRNEFRDLKSSVASLIKRHDSLKKQRPSISVDQSIDQPILEKSVAPLEKAIEIPEEDKSKSIDQNQIVQEDDNDLEAIRDDLENIAHRFELLTDEQRREESNEEAMLMKWLKHELKKEKCELDVLIQWYQGDKQKLEKSIIDLKQQLKSTEDKLSIAKMELEYVLVDLHDTGRELEFYKLEDNRSKIASKSHQIATTLRKCRSYEQLPSISDRKRSANSSTLTSDYFHLEHKYETLKKENDRLRQEVNIFKIDNALLEIERSNDQTEKSKPMKNNRQQSESDEFDGLKNQLNQAERCAYRLETEATQFMNEMASLKGRNKSKQRSNDQRISESVVVDSKSTNPDLIKELKKSEQKSIKIQLELDQANRLCNDLKTKLTSIGGKHQNLMIKQQQEIDRLKERHESELKSVHKALEQLRSSSMADKSMTSDEKERSILDLRQILDDTTMNLIDKSKELDKLERDVIFLKARLAESNSMVNQNQDDFSVSSFGAFVENLKIKHEIELKTLKREYDLDQQKTKKSKVHFADSTINGQKGPVDVVEDISLIDKSLSSDEKSISKSEKSPLSILETRLKDEYERAKSKISDESDEKLRKIEKELRMLHEELHLKSASYQEDLTKLMAENEDLRIRLHTKALNDPKFDLDNENEAKMELALKTAQVLQEKIDQLEKDMDTREKQHQEMYLLMFRKGQDAMKLEMDKLDVDNGGGSSTSSSEWSFEVGTAAAQSGKSTDQVQPLSKIGEESIEKKEISTKGGGTLQGHAQGGLSKDEIALQFLRDAVYYFLIDRDPKDHLSAIMSILKFSERQRQDVLKSKGFG